MCYLYIVHVPSESYIPAKTSSRSCHPPASKVCYHHQPAFALYIPAYSQPWAATMQLGDSPDGAAVPT